jgi:hypothetical protein
MACLQKARAYPRFPNESGGKKALFLPGSDVGGRNHATVADEGVAQIVVGWIKDREASHGGLR